MRVLYRDSENFESLAFVHCRKTQFRSLSYLSDVRTYVISGGPSLPDFLSIHFANSPEMYLLCSLGGGGVLHPPVATSLKEPSNFFCLSFLKCQ